MFKNNFLRRCDIHVGQCSATESAQIENMYWKEARQALVMTGEKQEQWIALGAGSCPPGQLMAAVTVGKMEWQCWWAVGIRVRVEAAGISWIAHVCNWTSKQRWGLAVRYLSVWFRRESGLEMWCRVISIQMLKNMSLGASLLALDWGRVLNACCPFPQSLSSLESRCYWESTSAWKSKENPDNLIFNKRRKNNIFRKEAFLEFDLIWGSFWNSVWIFQHIILLDLGLFISFHFNKLAI